MCSRMAWAWKSGPVSMRTVWGAWSSDERLRAASEDVGHSMRMEGRVRRFFEPGIRASAQMAQGQPRVGTPMLVPLPKNVNVACIKSFEILAPACLRWKSTNFFGVLRLRPAQERAGLRSG